MAQDRTKRGPRDAQDGPRWSKRGPREAHEMPKRAHEDPRGPKRCPREPKRAQEKPKKTKVSKNICFSLVFKDFHKPVLAWNGKRAQIGACQHELKVAGNGRALENMLKDLELH